MLVLIIEMILYLDHALQNLNMNLKLSHVSLSKYLDAPSIRHGFNYMPDNSHGCSLTIVLRTTVDEFNTTPKIQRMRMGLMSYPGHTA